MGPPNSALRSLGRFARESALTVLALGGVACIVLTVLAFAGGFSLIMFKTGSMSPTIPAGSVALVKKVAAEEIAVGDILTVDRVDALPITHRVTSVTPSASDTERVITMRGDANDADDPLPYTVTEARTVIGSVPHLAHVIVWFGNPWVLGGITLGAAALVTWAFWPRDPNRRREADASDSDDSRSDSSGPQTRRERRLASLAAVAIGLCACGSVSWSAAPALAAADMVSIRSDLEPTATYPLDPVEPLLWHVDVDASGAPDDGELTLSLAARGSETLGLAAEVRSCAVAWTEAGCADGERMLRNAGMLDTTGTWAELLTDRTPAAAHVRMALTAASTADDTGAVSVTVRAVVGQTVVDETLNGEHLLAHTGGQSLVIFAAPVAVLVGIGIALIEAARRREKR